MDGEPVDFTRDGAFEAAEDVFLGFAFLDTFVSVNAGVWVGGEADKRDVVERAVRCPVAAPVETVTGGGS
jgi:hypothetical protein